MLGFLALLAATAMTGLTGCSSSADRLRNTFAASPAAQRPPFPVSRAAEYCVAVGRPRQQARCSDKAMRPRQHGVRDGIRGGLRVVGESEVCDDEADQSDTVFTLGPFGPDVATAEPEWLRLWRMGWSDALFVFGLRDCTVTNDGPDVMRLPIGRREAYIDLAPGETVSIRAVRPHEPDPRGDSSDGQGTGRQAE